MHKGKKKTKIKINRTIKFLMISDIFIISGFGLITPIMAVFINDNIEGGTILGAGIASTIFMVVKSIIQLPFSNHVDSHDDQDDLKWLLIGMFAIVTVPFIYFFSSSMQHIYIAQIIYGIGSGLAYPTWMGLWSTHLDKNKESFEWSLWSTFVSLGSALAAVSGAAIAEYFGFKATFIFVGSFLIIGYACLFPIRSSVCKSKKKSKKKKIK